MSLSVVWNIIQIINLYVIYTVVMTTVNLLVSSAISLYVAGANMVNVHHLECAS